MDKDDEEKVTIKKKFKQTPYYAILCKIIETMHENKIYLLSFVISFVFIVTVSVYNIARGEALYNDVKPNKKDDIIYNVDDINIKSYVGYYKRDVILDEEIKVNDRLSIKDYKLVYEIKEDKTIIKYFYIDKLGYKKIWEDKLVYSSSEDAKYLSSHGINFLFSYSSMKETDGDTYVSDKNMKFTNEINDFDVSFDKDNILILTNDNLYSLNESSVKDILGEFKSNGGTLNKRVYKSSKEDVYNIIVFYNEENRNCYSDFQGEDDSLVYRIYTYNYKTKEKQMKVSRNKSDNCKSFDEDIKLLKE